MISFLYSLILLVHPIHVTNTEIMYNEDRKSFEIISRIFIDDLETCIRHSNGMPALNILEPSNGLTTNGLIENYLRQHFQLKADDKLKDFNFLGSETDGAAIVCYFEIEKINKAKTIEVANDVMFELYDDQSNLVHITYNEPVKSVRLTHEKPSEVFMFEKN